MLYRQLVPSAVGINEAATPEAIVME